MASDEDYAVSAYVTSVMGLHGRPSYCFVLHAQKFVDNDIQISSVSWDGNLLTVNAKSVMGVMMLTARVADIVSIRVIGKNAKHIACGLRDLIEDGLGEVRFSIPYTDDPEELAASIYLSMGLLDKVVSIADDPRLEAYFSGLGKPHGNRKEILKHMLVGDESYTVKAFSVRIADMIEYFRTCENVKHKFDKDIFSDRLTDIISKEVEGVINDNQR